MKSSQQEIQQEIQQEAQPNNHEAPGINRRTVLKAGAGTVTIGTILSALGCSSSGISNSESIIGSDCLTILYTNGPDVTFDYDYYRENHLTLIMDRYGDSIERFELLKPVITEGFPPPNYIAVVNIWIRDAEAFAAAGAEHGGEVGSDVPNFTNTGLVVQTDTVWGESGAPLHSTEMGQRCMCIFYPNEEGARWDADYYRDGHMVLIMDLYGTEAIRRFEVRKGPEPAAGGPPSMFMGSVNFYIENQAAFDVAQAEHTATLLADIPNFSSVNPSVVTTEIYGIGV